MSKMNELTEKITEGLEKIEAGVVTGYKQIEEGVVTGYQKIESGVVDGFNKMTDQFVGKFLTKEGETVEEAKTRIAEDRKAREEKQKARIEAGRNTGKDR